MFASDNIRLDPIGYMRRHESREAVERFEEHYKNQVVGLLNADLGNVLGLHGETAGLDWKLAPLLKRYEDPLGASLRLNSWYEFYDIATIAGHVAITDYETEHADEPVKIAATEWHKSPDGLVDRTYYPVRKNSFSIVKPAVDVEAGVLGVIEVEQLARFHDFQSFVGQLES